MMVKKKKAKVIAFPGRDAAGSVGGNNQQAEHLPLHFHLKLPDGREARFLSDTFEIFPGDERKVTREHYKLIKNLTEAQRWYITKATHDMFYRGTVLPQTRDGLVTRTIGKIPRDTDRK